MYRPCGRREGERAWVGVIKNRRCCRDGDGMEVVRGDEGLERIGVVDLAAMINVKKQGRRKKERRKEGNEKKKKIRQITNRLKVRVERSEQGTRGSVSGSPADLLPNTHTHIRDITRAGLICCG